MLFEHLEKLIGFGSTPSETVDVIYVVLFGVIFVGMIVAFFLYLWWKERKRKPVEKAPDKVK